MILAVNIGNTNVRAAIGQNSSVSDAALSVEALSESERFAHFIEQHFGEDLWDQIDGSIISSVVPNLTPVVMESILKMTGKAPHRIDFQRCGELSVRRYNDIPGEDRVVCCVGALEKYEPPFILIDFGTATTINVVNNAKEFLGGAILAGVQIGLKALAEYTAQLPSIDINSDIPIIGKNTKDNLVSGAVIGAACVVEGYIRRIECELNCTMPVIVTGGHAPIILPFCGFENIHEPNLLLEGLFALYKDRIQN